jgi:hypothetical protein
MLSFFAGSPMPNNRCNSRSPEINAQINDPGFWVDR